MQFRTEVNPSLTKIEINHQSRVLTLGSCFSDNIGTKLESGGIKVINNPFGTIFNPISLSNIIDKCYEGIELDPNLFTSDNKHHELHSSFGGANKDSIAQKFNKKCKKVLELEPTCIIITLGSSFIYRRKSDNKIVSNCHKVPQSEFKKELISIEEITSSLNNVISHYFHKPIILTVSPVRHTKDGIEENALSKALLRIACNEVIGNNDNVSYFPTYEIFMDDLRDYRFYKEDLVHPNEMGIEYTWEKFQSCCFNESTATLYNQVKKINQAVNHRSISNNPEKDTEHLKRTLAKAQELSGQVDMSLIIAKIEKRLDEL